MQCKFTAERGSTKDLIKSYCSTAPRKYFVVNMNYCCDEVKMFRRQHSYSSGWIVWFTSKPWNLSWFMPVSTEQQWIIALKIPEIFQNKILLFYIFSVKLCVDSQIAGTKRGTTARIRSSRWCSSGCMCHWRHTWTCFFFYQDPKTDASQATH